MYSVVLSCTVWYYCIPVCGCLKHLYHLKITVHGIRFVWHEHSACFLRGHSSTFVDLKKYIKRDPSSGKLIKLCILLIVYR